ncbi:hypothetical protein LGH82_02905 [Mesorhizobium sp. PAMC28654]|uniref:hypothetical protein n=1 Tax=Mesorhizobium sp. PAMC28654 TaxID=2880934 RepID=UPI001D09D185|nr:hypothetical protein [Mesorhizobium sp. PAMC28654]UDL90347.1 hypothetical protein LGH82_02905 [Mesorhizobium sp. PAMC28654]
MTTHPCAMPSCPHPATGIFCPSHYFALLPKDAQWLVRWQIKMLRCEDADTQQHMREQLQGYTAQAVRTLQSSEAKSSSQAASDSARRTTTAAGANQQAHPNG